jgi:hypothetical protein
VIARQRNARRAARRDSGVQRFYVWFADFAPPKSIAEFGESVIGS